jgi:hypothetical protein
MNSKEFVTHIKYNDIDIDVGIDDYGQTYFIEYKDEDGTLRQKCVGAYVTSYIDYIEYRFGKPEKNCPIYKLVKTSETESCRTANKMFCTSCRKFYNDLQWDWREKQKSKLKEVLKEKYDRNNIT